MKSKEVEQTNCEPITAEEFMDYGRRMCEINDAIYDRLPWSSETITYNPKREI